MADEMQACYISSMPPVGDAPSPIPMPLVDGVPPRVGQVLPEFAEEVIRALREAGEPGLASGFKELPLVSRCSCRQGDCSTFDTAERDPSMYDYSIELDVDGFVVVDIDTQGRVIGVEVLDRGDVHKALAPWFDT